MHTRTRLLEQAGVLFAVGRGDLENELHHSNLAQGNGIDHLREADGSVSDDKVDSHSFGRVRNSSRPGMARRRGVLTVGAVNPQNLQAGKENLGMANVLLDQVDGDVQGAA